MLALRLKEGICETDFRSRFGHSFREKYAGKLAPFYARGLLQNEGDRTGLSDEGLYLCSALLKDLLP